MAACGRSGSHAVDLSTPEPYRLQPGELVLAAVEDAIPAIFAREAYFVDPAVGDREWEDAEPVIGLVVQGEARAYPVRLMSLHEVVNDRVGGRPVAVTWCPLCYSALVYDRIVEGQELTFGVSGYLLHNNLVLYDHQSNTLWSQLLGQGIKGAYSGSRLNLIPSTLTTWGTWKDAYPGTQVLSARALDLYEGEIQDPYAGYYTSGAAGLGGSADPDARLKGKALVAGWGGGERALAFSLELLQERRLVQVEHDGVDLAAVYDPIWQTIHVYQRSAGGRTLTFRPGADPLRIVDLETRSRWDIRTGTAVSGRLRGEQLLRVEAPLVFWFAWSAHHPDSEVLRLP